MASQSILAHCQVPRRRGQLPEQAENRYAGRAVVAQLKQADLLVLNKIDLVSAGRLAETRALLVKHAPRTPVVECARGNGLACAKKGQVSMHVNPDMHKKRGFLDTTTADI